MADGRCYKSTQSVCSRESFDEHRLFNGISNLFILLTVFFSSNLVPIDFFVKYLTACMLLCYFNTTVGSI